MFSLMGMNHEAHNPWVLHFTWLSDSFLLAGSSELYPNHTDYTPAILSIPLPEDYFLPFSPLRFTNTCNLIVVCTVFGAGTFFKPCSPSSTSFPAHTHHLPFLGLFHFMKMSSFILSRRTSLIQVDTALN